MTRLKVWQPDMEKLVKQTQKKFIATIMVVMAVVVASAWGILQIYNQQEIATPATSADVHHSAENNQAFAEYLEEEKDFEAHFITLASDIKQQDADRLTRALAVTSVIVIIGGIGVSVWAARRLMQPVRAAYESQERFVQDAAHELRNPLAAMTAALQQSKQDTPLTKTFERQTKRLININEDLLFLERRSHQTPSKLNLSELIGDVVEEVQPLASSKNVTIELDSEPGLHKTMVATDYVRLVKNIVDNAVKYSLDDSSVSIAQQKKKSHIIITVQDHGIGIPKKDTDRIGQRFFRASNTGPIDGTGLGLAIVRKILNTYGGSFKIDSQPNKGTTVTISLPA